MEKRQWSGAVNGIEGLRTAPSTPHKTRDWTRLVVQSALQNEACQRERVNMKGVVCSFSCMLTTSSP